MAIFKKYYFLFLTLIVLVSYGQILGMYVWRDDNAVFFKFTHLNERAGYLGIGLLGSQPYKLTVTPYYFIYKLFGTDNLIPYYALALIFYLLTTLVVYKTFSQIVSEKVGKITGFLFACGYIASDGFMWLTTSITQSLSIIFVMAVLYFYEKWYWLSLGSYFLASYFNPARTHYFIVVIMFFEFLFFVKKINFTNILNSLFRLSPFLFIFYKYILSGDSRTGEPLSVLKLILSGQLRYLHSFIMTTGQIVFPMITNPGLLISILMFLGLITLTFSTKGKDRKYIILFSIWMFANLYAFSSLEPFSSYSATVRYLAHSFVPLIGILALMALKHRLITIMVILWGLVNLVTSVGYQNEIIKSKSIPARKFYQQLKTQLPSINKGDVLYFDIARGDETNFDSAFRVGQMPEETAVAWRYNLDRYDFSILTEFPQKIDPEKIHSFFYSNQNLINTTDKFKQGLLNPREIKIQARATLGEVKINDNPILDEKYQDLAFQYQRDKEVFRKTAKLSSVIVHRDNLVENILDGDVNTAWRSDRDLFSENKGVGLSIDLGSIKAIDHLVWINAYSVSTPTKYEIYTSLDNINWILLKSVSQTSSLDSTQLQIIEFPKLNTRYIKINFKETLNQDSPGISEIWLVSTEVPIAKAEKFLFDPLVSVTSQASFLNILKNLNNQLAYRLEWKDDQDPNNWKSAFGVENKVVIDGKIHEYRFVVPVRGTRLIDFRLSGSDVIDLKIVGSNE